MPSVRRSLAGLVALGLALGGCGAARENAEPLALVIWSSGALPTAVVEGLRAGPGVVAASPVASGMLDLRAVRGATRRLPRRVRDGIIPVSAAAIEGTALAGTPQTRAIAAALRRGEAVLSPVAARLRGMGPGDYVRLGGNGREERFRVGLVARAEHELGAEVIVPLREGRRLGLRSRRALVLAIAAEDLVDALPSIREGLAGMPFRVRSLIDVIPNEPHALLPLGEIKRIFGEFSLRSDGGPWLRIDPAWVERNIVEATLPGVGHVRCHRTIMPLLAGAMRELERMGLIGLVHTYDGCWVPRVMRTNTTVISRHAYGIAIDINASENGLGRVPTQDRRLVEVMKRWGFAWGGHFLNPDGMHFEFVRFPDAR